MRQYTFLGIAVVLLVFAMGFDRMNRKSLNPKRYISKLENYINKQEREIDEIFKDEMLLRKLINRDFEEQDWELLQNLSNARFRLYIYEQDSLIYWSNNTVLPYNTEIKYTTYRKVKFIDIKESQYVLIKESFNFDEDSQRNFTIVGLIPVYNKYPVENQYLESRFATLTPIPKSVKINKKPTEFPVMSSKDKPLFYLTATSAFTDYGTQVGLLFFYLLGFLFLAVYINQLATYISKKHQPIYGLLFLCSTLLILRFTSIYFNFFERFNELKLFMSDGYVESLAAWSVGELAINALLMMWTVIFFYKEVPIHKTANLSFRQKNLLVFGIYLSIFLSLFGLSNLVDGMIVNSNVSFDFNDIFSLDGYSFLGILAFVFLLFTLFLYSVKSFSIIRTVKLHSNQSLKLLLGVLLFAIILNITSIGYTITILLLLFSVLYINLFDFFTKKETTNFTWLVTWLLIFSAFSFGLLFIHNNKRETLETMDFAQKLAFERDAEVEKRFLKIGQDIKNDNFIREIDNLFIPRTKIIEPIAKQYLADPYIFNKYDQEIYLYSPGRKERPRKAYFQNRLTEAETTDNPDLFFWTNHKGRFYYLADLEITDENEEKGSIIIKLSPKRLDKSKVYPELLMDEELNDQKKFSKYDYAIYRDGKKLIEENKSYGANLEFDMPKEGTFSIERKNKRKYLLFNASNKKAVIIGKDRDEILKPMSLFSYMFCFLAVVMFALSVFNLFVKIIPNMPTLGFQLKASLRNRIQTVVIGGIIIIFVIIAVVTVLYFRSDSEEYHTKRLGRKARAIMASANNQLESRGWKRDLDITSLSKIHKMDINFYDLEGQLIGTSQKEIFDKGLVSERMAAVPFQKILSKQLSDVPYQERIGDLRYRSKYLSIKNPDNEILGIIGLPYYSEQSDLRNDVTDFMGALLNVYVFLLLFAGIAAILIANSITRPLAVLGQKLKGVTLGQKNEPLKWETNDEIGALIEEYNKMISELDKSANLLAKSEREGAWREMAKQVAHEIKNPLTPMKLSIQYLTRAYESRPEAIGPLMKRVSGTLIEQIDSLSRIASEFSNFAKMPTAQNEHFILNDLVNSVYTLFQEGEKEGEHVEVSLDMTDMQCEVFADKEQLGRVFNNIIKNAIQAVPEEREGVVDIKMATSFDKAVVTVRDNGIGIPEDKWQKIFVPNFTTKNSGTGLGLAISKNIVEAAGGQIYFKTEENVGTTFFIEIPIVQNSDKEDSQEITTESTPSDL